MLWVGVCEGYMCTCVGVSGCMSLYCAFLRGVCVYLRSLLTECIYIYMYILYFHIIQLPPPLTTTTQCKLLKCPCSFHVHTSTSTYTTTTHLHFHIYNYHHTDQNHTVQVAGVQVQYLRQWVDEKAPPVQVAEGEPPCVQVDYLR